MKQNYTKKIVKYFDSLVEGILFKLKDKTNYFFKKNTKTNSFHKFLISVFSLLLFYLFYLLIPSYYDKTWVQNTLENKLIEDFKIDFSMSADITYGILPSPHFLIKDVKIFVNDNDKKKELSEIKKLKVFIDQTNFFKKNNLNISKVNIHNANFSFQGDDIKLVNKASHNKFSNKLIKIYNGKIFFKDSQNEIIAITKVKFASLFYDDLKKLNLVNLEGEIFNTPFNFYLNKDFSSTGVKEVNFKVKKLKLNINDKLIKKTDGFINGLNIFSFFNSKTHTKYSIKKKLVSFEFDESKIKSSNKDYKGKLSFEPFELELDISLIKYDLFKLLNFNSIIGELFKSKLLLNEKLNANISINIASNLNKEYFSSTALKFNIVNGKLNFDKTKLVNNKIGLIEVNNSNLFFEKNNLILSSDIMIDINNSDNLFSFFLTSKKFRKPIKKVIINFDYNLVKKQLNIKDIKIDGVKNNTEMLNIMQDIKDIENYNLNKTKRMFNRLFSAYVG